MRRETNITKYIIISFLIIAIAIISLISFLISRGRKSAEESQFAEEISKFSDEMNKTDTASSTIGKDVEESEKELSEVDKDENNKIDEISMEDNKDKQKSEKNSQQVEQKKGQKNEIKQTTSKTVTENKKTTTNNADNKNVAETNSEVKKEETIEMEAPIRGEILREFAKDSLVFSNTLQEWVTHNGIDIKADKTSVVKAAANGTVSAIKNDPRYGLTVIITHDNGDKTVYSNLLTAEFVVKDEKVEKGQSIGTVGNSASFEVADEYHLHFELIRNNEYVNPVIYIDFD